LRWSIDHVDTGVTDMFARIGDELLTATTATTTTTEERPS
jgi:hypothetical protein